MNLRERDGELTPEEDAAAPARSTYTDDYRQGFEAGARAQRERDVIALKNDGRGGAPYWLESQPLVTPPEPE